MTKTMDWFERIVVTMLIVVMMVIILLGLIAFGLKLYQDSGRSLVELVSLDLILELFGDALLILIGVELLDTMRAYLVEHIVHVEIVLEVALIAVARKVIILNFKEVPSGTLFGIAALVIAVAVAFYREKRGRRKYMKIVQGS